MLDVRPANSVQSQATSVSLALSDGLSTSVDVPPLSYVVSISSLPFCGDDASSVHDSLKSKQKRNTNKD